MYDRELILYRRINLSQELKNLYTLTNSMRNKFGVTFHSVEIGINNVTYC